LYKVVIVMATRKTEKADKYAGYRYELDSQTELEEAKWLVSIGAFKSVEDFIDSNTRAHINWMKEQDAEKARKAKLRKQKRAAKNSNRKAA